MVIDATFWVAISFIIFIGGLVYLKIPQKINDVLNKLILDIKNEIDESEKLRLEAKSLMDNAQNKLDTAQAVSSNILEQAKKDSDHLVIEMNDKFHKSSEIKKNLAENKITQMKDAALKEIKDVSIKIAVESVKKSGLVSIITQPADNNCIEIIIEDNGKGMSQKFVSEGLFEPFKSTKGVSGMGVGVYQCREYLRSIQGDIRVKSQQNVGTCFTIKFPFYYE